MEIIDNGHTVPKYVLIILPKIYSTDLPYEKRPLEGHYHSIHGIQDF